jgi:hypothetical protein
MRMTENDGVDLFWIKGKLAIALDRFLALALEEAAFKQQAVAVNFEEIH